MTGRGMTAGRCFVKGKMYPMEKQYAYEKIYREILADISSGKLLPGAVLPSECELAKKYQVSRITSRRALTMLADEGYIIRKKGVGSEVLPRKKQIRTIGLAMANIDPMFGMDFIRGVLQEARKHGYLVICQIGYFLSGHEEQHIQELADAEVCGIITIPLYEAVHCTNAFVDLARKIPMVFADREIVGLDVPLVCTDNLEATEKLCRSLYEQEHRKIAFISSNTKSTAVSQRFKAYCLFCEKMNVNNGRPVCFTDVKSVLPGMDRPDVQSRDVAELVRFLRENRGITAIVAHTYQVGRLVCEAIRVLGYQIPKDYSVVCFDAPKLTEGQEYLGHIRQDEYGIGTRAVQCLVRSIEGGYVEPVTYVDSEYVAGKSCGRAPERTRE